MKGPKSNTIIPVAAKIYFEASCYDLSARVQCSSEQLFGLSRCIITDIVNLPMS